MSAFFISRCTAHHLQSPCPILQHHPISFLSTSRNFNFLRKLPNRWHGNSLSSALVLRASSTDLGADGQPEKFEVVEHWDEDEDKKKGIEKLALAVGTLISAATIISFAVTWTSGGPSAFVQAIAKSGFAAAFALIFVSEIGDKTFFIAALLAMKHSRSLVLLGASAALSLMTIISVVIGRIFHAVPAQLKTTLPIGEYAAVALLVFFGLKSLKVAWDMPSSSPKSKANEPPEISEFSEAEEFIKKSEVDQSSSSLEIFMETFSLVFLAEWGDRSMLATIALGAAQAPFGVASGAIVGHVIATGLAVLGGAFLAQYISEKMVSYIGGLLFLGFAAATLLGVF